MTTAPATATSAAAALAVLRAAGDHPIVRGLPQGAIIVFDADLRYLAAGGLGLADVGLSREMLEGNTIHDVFPPDVAEAIEPLFRRALAGYESSIDVPFQDRIYLQRLGPLRDAAGGIIAGMGITQDVTQARRAELELIESEQRFRLAFDHGPVPMALIGLDGVYQQVNPAMCAFTGYPAGQMVGMTMADLGHPEDLAADLAAMADLHAGDRSTYAVENRYLTSRGTIIWGAKSATLARRKDGTALHFIVQIQDITERKQHEQTLAEEHRRLHDAESIGRTGSWELDIATKAVTWSAGMFVLWGIEPSTFGGDYAAVARQIDAADVAAVDTAVEACVSTGEPFIVRYRVTRANDGAVRWIEARGAARYEDGRAVRVGGAVIDITDQVAAEADITTANAFQRAVFSASPDIIAVWDFESGSIVWANRSIPGLLGYSQEDIDQMGVGRSWNLVHPEDRARVGALMAAARDAPDDEVVHMDYRMVRKDGSIRWFAQRTTPLSRDGQGRVTQIAGVMSDTTDDMAARADLLESRKRFGQLADTVNVGFVLRNLDPSTFLYVSRGFERIFGFNPMTDQGDPAATLRRITHPDDLELTEAYWAKAALGLAAQAEFRTVRPDGDIRWVHVASAPVVDPDGRIRRTATTSEDITDRKLAEAAQRAAETRARATALQDELLSRMSHELRTPLNAVLGFGQLLEMDDLRAEQQDSVQHILRGGRHLVGLVDDVLDITRLRGDTMELAIEAVTISTLLTEIVQLMGPTAAAAQVTLDYEPGAAVGQQVSADRLRLRQVLQNLLSNAIKYNIPGGRVRITCAASRSRLDIEVLDTGRGIRTVDLPRLFTPFDRLSAPADEIDGTGLGLALSRALMSAMGGTLTAASREGVGSTFTASIPLRIDDPAPSTTRKPAPSAQAEPTKTLLYIEDTSSSVRLMERLVARRPQWRMIVAQDGARGLELATTGAPDLVLMDLNLPDLNGIDVLGRLRAEPGTSALPVVVISAEVDPRQIERLLTAGAQAYLTKPLDVAQVLQMLDEDRSHQQ